jgi:hypothetical protein
VQYEVSDTHRLICVQFVQNKRVLTVHRSLSTFLHIQLKFTDYRVTKLKFMDIGTNNIVQLINLMFLSEMLFNMQLL